MKEKNRAEEWFRAKHDELAGTARANLAAHDLEPGQEAYHLDCFASMFVRQVRQCFSVVWADGFPRCRHRFPVM